VTERDDKPLMDGALMVADRSRDDRDREDRDRDRSRDDRSRDFNRYEINLVLESGERLNVFEHRSESIIRADARLLSVFLGKPVWDGLA